MKRVLFALSLVAMAGGSAWADDSRVHTSATVEVIDDKTQIDDVISRMRAQQALEKQQKTSTLHDAASLKVERVAPPTSATDGSHRAVAPEPKEQRPGSRRNTNEHGTLDRTERPKLKVHRR